MYFRIYLCRFFRHSGFEHGWNGHFILGWTQGLSSSSSSLQSLTLSLISLTGVEDEESSEWSALTSDESLSLVWLSCEMSKEFSCSSPRRLSTGICWSFSLWLLPVWTFKPRLDLEEKSQRSHLKGISLLPGLWLKVTEAEGEVVGAAACCWAMCYRVMITPPKCQFWPHSLLTSKWKFLLTKFTSCMDIG